MIDVETWLLSTSWGVLGIWVALYVGDYYLTIWGARLHAMGAKEHLVFEGSYELTPQFQKDINGLRTVSPRFLGYLALSSGVILLAWFLVRDRPEWQFAFLLLYGGLVFRQLAVLVRHSRNIALFRNLKEHKGVEGRLRYSQWLTLEQSWVELAFLALLMFAAALVAAKVMLFGGAWALFVTGLEHRTLSRKKRSESEVREASNKVVQAVGGSETGENG